MPSKAHLIEFANSIRSFVSYLKPFCSAVEVHQINNYMPIMKAYDSRDPEAIARPEHVTDEQWGEYIENSKRYINASTPAEALGIWLETEPITAGPGAPGLNASGGAGSAKAREVAQRIGL